MAFFQQIHDFYIVVENAKQESAMAVIIDERVEEEIPK